MPIAYAFEAKSIQGYILDGGKLRDMAGASALVDGLCNYPEEGGEDLLGQALKASGWSDAGIARRSGGAFILIGSGTDGPRIAGFRRLWTLLVQTRVPGLAFVEATGQGDDEAAAIRAATLALLPARSRLSAVMPATPPLARRSPRTGTAATAVWRPDGELIDAATAVKRANISSGGGGLTRKFAAPEGVEWPIRMDEEEEADDRRGAVFPLLADNRYVAVVHADGNRLGETLIGLQGMLAGAPDYAGHFLAFSQAVAAATQRAAAAATADMLERYRETLDPSAAVAVMPMRPILLGGDDLTVIVRGDLAIAFTVGFLEAFARETGAAFDRLRADYPAMRDALPKALSAGAGIAFTKASQPFHLAHDLAASLADHAKSGAKEAAAAGQVPSSCLAFHRVTTALIDDYGTVRERELSGHLPVPAGAAVTHAIEATLNPYLVVPGEVDGPGFPKLSNLLELVDVLNKPEVSRGPLRRLVGLARSDPAEGRRIYRRWREVMGNSTLRGYLDELDGTLSKLGCDPDTAAVREVRENGHWMVEFAGSAASRSSLETRERSPLLDALSVLAVARGGAAVVSDRPVGEVAA
ncbi:MAG: hypothetical protein RLO51_16360 [Thalassobaculum sp.]|uniref:Cas10/Cmr2 second palm domain-containing protein n=1 Tax=Thalassobaculum sp. TaxID=2022740 RepID=UPI0032EE7458